MNTCNRPDTFTRNYSRGKSFAFSEWSPRYSYINDNFKQDFVTYKGDLYACITSNTNTDPSTSKNWLKVICKLPAITFIPSVDSEGNLVWSERTGDEMPESTNIKGPQGEQGVKGDTGPIGPQGLRGEKGEKGDKGASGNGNLEVGKIDPSNPGQVNDIYLNLTTGEFFKWKNKWESIGKVTPSAGEDVPELTWRDYD